jgi:sugar phosphate isomerase/epimerase
MRLGAYTACLHDLPIADALNTLADLGLDSAEINSGGFLGTPHLPIDDLRCSETARSSYVGLYRDAGITLTAPNCNGNPLDPDAEGRKQAQDIYTSIELAALLGVKRIVTMSGAPGSEPSSTLPVWNVLPWHSAFLRIQDYQSNEVAIAFWKKVQADAADHDVKVCLEMHPGNVVFNPHTMERLATEINATHVGAEMDPSHLFGRASIQLRRRSRSAHWCTTPRRRTPESIRPPKINGTIDDSFTYVPEGDPRWLSMGGPHTLSGWPTNPSWDFVAVGRGHDVDWWTGFLHALEAIDEDMAVNIEHEDQELDQMEGLRYAAETLLKAAGR